MALLRGGTPLALPPSRRLLDEPGHPRRAKRSRCDPARPGRRVGGRARHRQCRARRPLRARGRAWPGSRLRHNDRGDGTGATRGFRAGACSATSSRTRGASTASRIQRNPSSISPRWSKCDSSARPRRPAARRLSASALSTGSARWPDRGHERRLDPLNRGDEQHARRRTPRSRGVVHQLLEVVQHQRRCTHAKSHACGGSAVVRRPARPPGGLEPRSTRTPGPAGSSA